MKPHELELRDVNVFYRKTRVVGDFSAKFQPGMITGIIGPSGAGKSSVLLACNKLIYERNGSSTGRIMIDGKNINDKDVNPTKLRRHVGMIFQEPDALPAMSIANNVLIGYNLVHGDASKKERALALEENLTKTGLWDQVRNRLDSSGAQLSGGQKQRLCLARLFAYKPGVVLLDEPCSALDVNSIGVFEELLVSMKGSYTMAMVTHNLAQARRICDWLIVMFPDEKGVGRIVEMGPTEEVFAHPQNPLTAALLSGKIG